MLTVLTQQPFGARRVDHLALTVGDLEKSIRFVVDVLGGELVYRLPALAHQEDDWMSRHLDVHPRARAEIAMLRLGPVTNLELFEYWAPKHNEVAPRPHDVGSTVLGLFVEDIELAVEYLRKQPRVSVLGAVQTVRGAAPEAGMRWIRFLAPWGSPIELRSFQRALPYESHCTARRFGPCAAWSNRNDGVRSRSPMPGLRSVDHVAYTVANLEAALEFFVEVLGAEYVYRTSVKLNDPSVAQGLGVPPRGRMERAVLRMGPTDNIELNQFWVAHARNLPPCHSDVGGRHLALHVDDVTKAAAQLACVPGCTVLGPPQTICEGLIAGDRWVYVRTPIGLHVELVHMPDGALPYEEKTSARRRPTAGLRWTDR